MRVLLFDDLLGKLTAHELSLHDDGKSDVTPAMKNLALKANKHKESSSENEESDDEEDPFALIIRGLEVIMKMQKKYKKFKSRNKGVNLLIPILKLTNLLVLSVDLQSIL